ncbi:DNA polymerase subunit beta [Streptomyces sp. CS159]|uniref:nucleotidyltransferase domain-containing protein n=1 Tax=Streptomyces sp. CS159 TaxID=1982762 RepID=UPI000B4158E4|nr:nucleotidyltransferase domain-containing protein [Streptomyces sp. CS159]OWA07944.1 DNA polymerase subunit beta [Streptomyces sp. CS159]
MPTPTSTPTLTDQAFLDTTADRLAALPAVRAVTLGGSRAQGTHGPDSDWDLAVYYRGAFDPDDLRAVGWEGEISEIGAWGGGVFNGGAWLTVDGRRVDVHYRDLDVVEHEETEARAGRFGVEPLMFHLAGIPTYLVVAELAINKVLRGSLPRPAYPEALRTTAPDRWYGATTATLAYARAGHAPRGALTQVAGALALATTQTAHAVLAARGEWVTNEKGMVGRAGLDGVDALVAALTPEPESLARAVDDCGTLLDRAVRTARSG